MPKFLFILEREYLGRFSAKVRISEQNRKEMPKFRLNRFFIGVNEYDSYEMLTFASWKTKVC